MGYASLSGGDLIRNLLGADNTADPLDQGALKRDHLVERIHLDFFRTIS